MRGTVLVLLVVNILFGGWCVDAILSWFSKDIPFIADCVIGLFAGEIVIPVAIVGELLKVFGVF